ncbi:MAG: recombinase family protein [Pirellulales bacterium]
MKQLRAVGYCRTSSEGQRDNTSIPRQKEDIERFIEFNGWEFCGFYIDECKSGKSIVGREDFQRMMREAAVDKFDIVVPYDMSRFGRAGLDIIQSAETLKREFGVHVVDTKGSFDTRDNRRTLNNYVQAGVAEDERLRILDRTGKGRIRKAQIGEPWGNSRPVGRDYDRKAKRWYINESGRAIRDILKRYLEGEGLAELCKEHGISSRSKISEWVWRGQLAGPYSATFNIPELGIVNMKVQVPGIPEVVSEALLAKVKARLQFNRTHNRVDVEAYPLTGFIRCKDCGQALTGQISHGKAWYRHRRKSTCSLVSVAGQEIEGPILDHLYGTFLDEHSFNKAVEKAVPTASVRQRFENDRISTTKALKRKKREADRLVNAIAKGADPELLLDKQSEIKAEIGKLKAREAKLRERIAELPNPGQIRETAAITRLFLVEKYKGRDWRKLPVNRVKRFLMHLFGDNVRATKRGILVQRDAEGRLRADFNGNVEFHHFISDERPISHALEITARTHNNAIRKELRGAIKSANIARQPRRAALKPCTAKETPESPGAICG